MWFPPTVVVYVRSLFHTPYHTDMTLPFHYKRPSHGQILFIFSVSSDERHECTKEGRINLRSPSGFLASRMAEIYSYGTSACPWVISVPPGQRLNLTLYNFARFTRPDMATGIMSPDPSVCYEIANIMDGPTRKNILTCGTDGRIKQVFISRTSSLEIRFVDRTVLRSLGQFLLHYKRKFVFITKKRNHWKTIR